MEMLYDGFRACSNFLVTHFQPQRGDIFVEKPFHQQEPRRGEILRCLPYGALIILTMSLLQRYRPSGATKQCYF
ncbi:MAG: hypothetical protein EAZ95_10660 [Bacteroidetes bacterium]|nr:MAG: hypothetical protein EAZ95_10660 [Bacteroidota bacterium]